MSLAADAEDSVVLDAVVLAAVGLATVLLVAVLPAAALLAAVLPAAVVPVVVLGAGCPASTARIGAAAVRGTRMRLSAGSG